MAPYNLLVATCFSTLDRMISSTIYIMRIQKIWLESLALPLARRRSPRDSLHTMDLAHAANDARAPGDQAAHPARRLRRS